MAVAFDAGTSTYTNVSGVALLTITNLTVGSGSNRGLVAGVFFGNGTIPTGITANWDNAGTPQAMTQIANAVISSDGVNSCTGALYGLVAPTSGNKQLRFAWTGNNEGHGFAISFTGVDQTSAAVAFPNGVKDAHASSASPCTITITSAVGNMVVSMFAQGIGSFGAVSGTQLCRDDVTGPAQGVLASYNNGAASVTQTAAFPGGGPWDAIGCTVAAAAGAASPTPYNPWPLRGPILAQKRRSFSGWDVHRTHRWRNQRGLLVPTRRIIKRAA